MNGRNCPNCGAPLELDKIKCPYCGTLYFDFTALDFTDCKPVFIKYKIPNGESVMYMTQCAIPRLGSIDIENESTDVMDCRGTVVRRICSNRTCTSNITFEAIPFGDKKELFRIDIPE